MTVLVEASRAGTNEPLRYKVATLLVKTLANASLTDRRAYMTLAQSDLPI